MSGPEISEQEARLRARQLFRAYLGMLSLVHAWHAGWEEVLETLEDAAREARDRVRIEAGEGR